MTDAATMELVIWDQATETDVSSLDLLAFSDGWEIIDNGYTPSEIEHGQSQVTESITFQVRGTTQDLVAAAIQEFETIWRQVYYANDIVENKVVMFRVKALHEMNARQAFVYSLEGKPASSIMGTQFDYSESNGNFFIEKYILTLTRGPWESLTSTDYGASDQISTLGGAMLLSGLDTTDVKGDVGARVSELITTSSILGYGTPYLKQWLGFKDTRGGVDPTKFIPIWNLHKASYKLTADTANASDSTAQDGTKVTTTFVVTVSMYKRLQIDVNDITVTDNAHQRGRYIVVLRAKISASSAINVRMGYGFQGYVYNVLNRVNIPYTSGAWGLYTLGEVDIPPSRGFSVVAPTSSIQIEAERTSADSATLDMDCLILIPSLNGAFSLTHDYSAGNNYVAYAQLPNDNDVCFVINSSGNQVTRPNISPKDFTIKPTASGVFVMAAEANGGSVKTDNIYFRLKLMQRWKNLRGSA